MPRDTQTVFKRLVGLLFVRVKCQLDLSWLFSFSGFSSFDFYLSWLLFWDQLLAHRVRRQSVSDWTKTMDASTMDASDPPVAGDAEEQSDLDAAILASRLTAHGARAKRFTHDFSQTHILEMTNSSMFEQFRRLNCVPVSCRPADGQHAEHHLLEPTVTCMQNYENSNPKYSRTKRQCGLASSAENTRKASLSASLSARLSLSVSECI